MPLSEGDARDLLAEFGQSHVLRFWDALDNASRQGLLALIEQVDFPLMRRLIAEWVVTTPPPESFKDIAPVPVIPAASHDNPDARRAWDAGEDALRQGRVGLFLVAGGQGTRLGLDGAIRPDARIPISTLGGLKARGHPVGATGIYQILEGAHQLRGTAGNSQIPGSPSLGMAQNLGGSAATVATTLLEAPH